MANYLIIGGDGKEYGPVTDTDVRQWLAEGRLNAQSRAKSESDAEFRPLAAFPEFADAFAPETAAAPETIAPLKPAAAGNFFGRDYELDHAGCITRGFQLFKDHFNLLFMVALVYGVIEGIIGGLGMIPIVNALAGLVNLVIGGPLLGGLLWVSLGAVRGQPGEVGDIFAGFRRCFGQLFLGNLIPGLLASLCLIPVAIAAVVIALPEVEQHQHIDPHRFIALIPIVIFCLIPMTYLKTCWLFTMPLIIDKQMDFGTAMKTSWRMVNKHWWSVFGLSLLIGLVNLAGAMACGVGLLFTMPIGFAALMYAYETIFGEPKN